MHPYRESRIKEARRLLYEWSECDPCSVEGQIVNEKFACFGRDDGLRALVEEIDYLRGLMCEMDGGKRAMDYVQYPHADVYVQHIAKQKAEIDSLRAELAVLRRGIEL